MTILLNYAHPLTLEQRQQLEALLGNMPEIRDIPTQVDRDLALSTVAQELANAAGLSAEEWQTLPIFINPPSLAQVALTLLAELHGRCGYFPPILNIRPVEASVPPRYEIANIVNLQEQRATARTRR